MLDVMEVGKNFLSEARTALGVQITPENTVLYVMPDLEVAVVQFPGRLRTWCGQQVGQVGTGMGDVGHARLHLIGRAASAVSPDYARWSANVSAHYTNRYFVGKYYGM